MDSLLVVIGIICFAVALMGLFPLFAGENSWELWAIIIILSILGMAAVSGGFYLHDQDNITKTICEQKEGTYAGGKCIKDGRIMEE